LSKFNKVQGPGCATINYSNVEEKHVKRNICGRKYATTREFRIHIPYILNFVFINNQQIHF
jgi:hypothetical protein